MDPPSHTGLFAFFFSLCTFYNFFMHFFCMHLFEYCRPSDCNYMGRGRFFQGSVSTSKELVTQRVICS